jgi:hypothetical protein
MKKLLVLTAILTIGAIMAACAAPTTNSVGDRPAAVTTGITADPSIPDEMLQLEAATENGMGQKVMTPTKIEDWSQVGDEMLLMGATGYGPAVTTAPSANLDWSQTPDEMIVLWRATGSQ